MIKGIDAKAYGKAKDIIVSGFKSRVAEDDIKKALLDTGFGFNDTIQLYKHIGEKEGFLRTAKQINEELQAEIGKVPFNKICANDPVEWTDIEPHVNEVMSAVKDLTIRKCLNAFSKKMNEYDVSMPKRPKSVGPRKNKVRDALNDLFHDHADETTKEMMKEKLLAVTTEKNTERYLRQFDFFYRLANGLDSEGK